MFAELLAAPGVTEELELRSRFGFLAFHGGSLERGTAEIAREAADRAGASLYAVRQPEELRWHVPSALVDPAHSTALASFLEHVSAVVSIHGYGRADLRATVLVGGADRALARRVAGHLGFALPDYEVVDDLERIPEALRGLHPDNPVNRSRAGGVQLELPVGVRQAGDARTALVSALTGLPSLGV